MQVIVTGAREVEAKLRALPGQLRRGIWDATPRAADLEAQTIRSLTPQRTGTLAGGIHTEVTETADGAKAKVIDGVRYASFVDRGTAEHGRAQHMFERGSKQVRGQAEDLYRVAVDDIVAVFG